MHFPKIMKEKDKALLRLYLGEHVREEGMLLEDLQIKNAIKEQLRSEGLIDIAKLNDIEIVNTTEEGAEKASSTLGSLIDACRGELLDLIEAKPQKVTSFVIRNHLTKDLSFSVDEKFFYGDDWNEAFLKHPFLISTRNDILERLIQLNLAVMVRHYRIEGDDVHYEARYSTSSEVQNLLSEIDPKVPLSQDEEGVLKLHFLLRKYSRYLDHENLENIDKIQSLLWNDMSSLSIDDNRLKNVVDNLAKDGVCTNYRGFVPGALPFKILRRTEFLNSIDKSLVRPMLFEWLGRKRRILPVKEKAEAPKKKREISESTVHWLDSVASMEDRLELYRRIFLFEERIRTLIITAMKMKHGKKWMNHMPEELKDTWKKRMKDDEKEGRESEANLIMYADFSDYLKIIQVFWKSIFQDIFKDLDSTKREFNRLNNLGRKPLMHSRPMYKDEIGSSNTAIKWISRRIDEWESLISGQ
jgi:hypothetical protein